jgi:hypothetical protein
LAYDSVNQHFIAFGFRYFAPQEKSQEPGIGSTSRSASQIGFTNNVMIMFTAADTSIVSTDVKIEGDKCRFRSLTQSAISSK